MYSSYPDRYYVMAAAASLTGKADKPITQIGVAELFKSSKFQTKSVFKGYDKATTSPTHGTLPKWKVDKEVFARLERGF